MLWSRQLRAAVFILPNQWQIAAAASYASSIGWFNKAADFFSKHVAPYAGTPGDGGPGITPQYFEALYKEITNSDTTAKDGQKENSSNQVNAQTAQPGGGWDDRKINEKREQSAKSKEQSLREDRDKLSAKPNKTPENKQQLRKVEKALQRERDRQKKSETHARKHKGQQG